MDPRMLRYYNQELHHLRELGAEFAQQHPKIARRLALDGLECADPYVERLLEGFAFLAARVQLKLDSEFPSFTQHLLEMVYPHYVAPTPSMAVVQFRPDLTEPGLAEGHPLPRDTVLRSLIGKSDQTACEYRTAHPITLWPLELMSAEYLANPGTVTKAGGARFQRARAGIRLRLRTTAGLNFDALTLEALPVFVTGGEELALRLYELLVAASVGMVAQPVTRTQPPWREAIDRTHIRAMGFDDSEALLPYEPRAFQGYRLLHEYFAFPERYRFVELGGLGPAVRRCNDSELDLFLLFDRGDAELERSLDRSLFALFCAPAINLFPRRADRIHLTQQQHAYHVVPDRTRPMDFEIHQVTGVVGYGAGTTSEQTFQPFYAFGGPETRTEEGAYYTVWREPRRLSSQQRRQGPRSSYGGSEIFVSLVDAHEAPYSPDLRQLGVSTLCSNRDLPFFMPLGGKTDFTVETGAPIEAVRCVAGPTEPRPSHAHGETAWRLIGHLTCNVLSLTESAESDQAQALRELLGLYGELSDAHIRQQIEGVHGVSVQPVIRRLPMGGPITCGRGLAGGVTFDDAAYEGTEYFLLGAVLERFLARYASINSFTETALHTLKRGEVMRWPLRIGRRPSL